MLLVTGGTGNSGRYFFEKLAKENYTGKIRCIVRHDSQTTIKLSEKRRAFSKNNLDFIKHSRLDVEFVYGNLLDKDFLMASLVGVKTVLHIAGIHHSKNIISIGEKIGVDWFICVHTTGIFSKYPSINENYRSIEDKVIDNKNVTILRPTLIYGSGNDRKMSKLIHSISKGKFLPVVGFGKNLFQPVHAKDLANAYWSVLVSKKSLKGKQYNLAGKNKMTYKEMLYCISDNLDKRIILIFLPYTICLFFVHIYTFVHHVFKWREPYPEKSLIVTVEQVKRMTEDKAFSFDAATNDFRYSPMSFKKGIRDQINDLTEKTA
jgi:nucleoside-diphosphate-sugar epimerase|tara:strand:+ start:292 stop:1248 length:957 start_codon:yes stop_codon:yes gene_type:complete